MTAAALLLGLGGCASTTLPTLAPLDPSGESFDRATEQAVARDAASLTPAWLAPRTVDLTLPLEPDDVALIAVIANPDIRTFRKQAKVADAQVFAAGLLPDPTFSFGIDFVLTGPVTTLANALAGSLSQDFAGVRTRNVTLLQAEAQARQVRLDLAWAEWQTAGQARLLASQIIAAEQQLALLKDIARVSSSLSERTRRAAGRGDIGGDQLQATRLAELDATAQLRAAELALVQARMDLLKVLGLPPETQLQLRAGPTPVPFVPCGSLQKLAADRTDIVALREGYAAQDSAIRLAKLSAFPAPGLTINGSRNESGNRLGGPAISLTLPLWNRGRGTIAIAEATGGALQAQYDARLFQARADIATLCSVYTTASQQMAALQLELPGLDSFAVSTVRAARRGDLAQSVADGAELALWSKLVQVAQLEQSQRERIIGLEMTTGQKAEAWR
ncbi:MAG: TolC family protein [Novosphingobium sp.]